LGIAGAVTAIVISTVTLLALFLNPDYRPGAWGALTWFLCGLLYFALYARKRLIRSPEEEFALQRETVRR
jgi:ethanolamine permease